MQFTSTYEGALDQYLHNSAEQRRKVKEKNNTKEVHTYHVEDYGLTAEQIRAQFKEYIAKYC